MCFRSALKLFLSILKCYLTILLAITCLVCKLVVFFIKFYFLILNNELQTTKVKTLLIPTNITSNNQQKQQDSQINS